MTGITVMTVIIVITVITIISMIPIITISITITTLTIITHDLQLSCPSTHAQERLFTGSWRKTYFWSPLLSQAGFARKST